MNFYIQQKRPRYSQAQWESLRKGKWLKHIDGGRCKIKSIESTQLTVRWGRSKKDSIVHKDNIKNYKVINE